MKCVPRHSVARAQAEPLGEFEPCKSFKHGEHRRRVDNSGGDLFVAALPRLDGEVEWFDLAPERVVAKRLQPLPKVFPVFEHPHVFEHAGFVTPTPNLTLKHEENP